ncbi:hypothetical protein CS022_06830 [Veronia nyctiphanis]|uniref:PLD phosphodiesterase domain-containing protein n=1 Tax=Veronia nyctiphanis TaxID=1278244 RepID=A0A4Q0YY38_9GAMM|nr:phospholipase D-like domain-containing protein [Veronia nyctiphanis]RXJ73981.1 hypothetical protein CS022_06830 [Veronia nyctiphanis]
MLPANLLKKIAETMDGRVPCPDVELIMITNSMETTDLNLVNLFANHQLKALGEYQQAQTNKNGIRLRYLEHQFTVDASSHLSLHSKVMILGDDMFIGSANADVRSLMMDTNNGLFISRSPASTADYQKWLQGLINKGHIAPPKVNVINESRESLLLRDMAFLDTMISKYQVQQWLSRQQSQQLKNKFRTLLDETYILSRDIISKGGDADAAAKRFNALFKTI